jgi:hypothetical protein
MKDLLDFEDFFETTKKGIFTKHVRASAISEDYILCFQSLSDKID